MKPAFLALALSERADILAAMAVAMNRDASVLEKDVWVCWVLEQLFTMPERAEMAFKGGTSLSKAYRAIERFSEDVDITLDYRGHETEFDAFAPGASRTRQKTFAEELKARVATFVAEVVGPRLRQALHAVIGDEGRVDIDPDGESLLLFYPRAIAAAGGYQFDHVLIEFGGRNITDPSKVKVKPVPTTSWPPVMLSQRARRTVPGLLPAGRVPQPPCVKVV